MVNTVDVTDMSSSIMLKIGDDEDEIGDAAVEEVVEEVVRGVEVEIEEEQSCNAWTSEFILALSKTTISSKEGVGESEEESIVLVPSSLHCNRLLLLLNDLLFGYSFCN